MQHILVVILPLFIETVASLSTCPPAFVAAGRRRSTRVFATGEEGVLGSCRPTNGHDVISADVETDASHHMQSNTYSHIVSITSKNIAGMKNEDSRDEIVIRFAPSEGAGAGFVAVTGESGSGKSLLVSKAIDLVTGGKAVSSLISSTENEASESGVELVVNLFEPHLSAVSSSLKQFGVDPEILNNEQSLGQLHLSRIIQRADASGRMKSLCRINGKHVSLKTLRSISSPLFTRVDVATASAALSRPASRLAMMDTGVSDALKRECLECRNEYERAKKKRRQLEKELEERVLPEGMQRSVGGPISEEDMELLQHWIDELDNFESRVNTFREAILTQYNQLLNDSFNSNQDSGKGSNLNDILRNLKSCTWSDAKMSEDASLFGKLLEFREQVKAVETKLTSAHEAYELLSSVSAPESVSTTLDTVRKMLYGISRDDNGPLFDSIERTHELLNGMEEALNDCARSIDGDSKSVISTLEKMVCTGISLEQIDTIIADWNALARKHGISPYTLPKCHESLRQELDGNAEALMLLPEAKKEEQLALEQYSAICIELSDARNDVASTLSESVTELLPSLGLEGTSFQVQMSLRQGGYEDPHCGSESLGVDVADFLLLHQKPATSSQSNAKDTSANQAGGYIDQVGSSGEKSRVLLAIETSLPGSIGTTCNAYTTSSENTVSPNVQPLAIIYDEIDAHVGGRAAVTMAKLLADQTRRKSTACSQIIAITHSASVAAIADQHVVVERTAQRGDPTSQIRAFAVSGSDRSKEIARMASGDLATGEAEAFADALIRDAVLQRDMP